MVVTITPPHGRSHHITAHHHVTACPQVVSFFCEDEIDAGLNFTNILPSYGNVMVTCQVIQNQIIFILI